MAILVAGGCGYIGAHVAKLLSQNGYDVVVYDNLSRGYLNFAKWGEFVLGDIGDRVQLDLLFERFQIEAVMYFCALIEVFESVAKPFEYYRNNLSGTLNLLEAMSAHGVNAFIFSSTAGVYGTPAKIPIAEDDPQLPINPYGASKQMVERMLEDFSAAYNLRSIRLRYFNAAGADADGEIGEAHFPETHLIPLILDAALGRREGIAIYGTDYDTPDGTCVRDYIHVDDLAVAHLRGLQYLLGVDSGTLAINLGSKQGYSVREMIETVKMVTGREFKVESAPRRAGDPASLVADNSKAKMLLNWQPTKSLEEIVESAWIWHQRLSSIGLK